MLMFVAYLTVLSQHRLGVTNEYTKAVRSARFSSDRPNTQKSQTTYRYNNLLGVQLG